MVLTRKRLSNSLSDNWKSLLHRRTCFAWACALMVMMRNCLSYHISASQKSLVLRRTSFARAGALKVLMRKQSCEPYLKASEVAHALAHPLHLSVYSYDADENAAFGGVLR